MKIQNNIIWVRTSRQFFGLLDITTFTPTFLLNLKTRIEVLWVGNN